MGRLTLRISTTIIAIVAGLCAQDSPDKSVLIQQLTATAWEVRRAALSQVVSQPALLEDPTIQTAIIRLQETENAARISEDPDHDSYLDQVMATVLKVAKATNSGRAWGALLNASFNADSPFGESLARDRQAFPWIVQSAASAPGEMGAKTVGLLAEALHDRKSQAAQANNGDQSANATTYNSAKQILIARAQARDRSDDDLLVRLAAIKGLGTVRDAGDETVLQTIADDAAGHSDEASAAVRRTANRALQAAIK